MLVAIVLLHCGDCFNLLMAQHMVGVLQMVSSAGFYITLFLDPEQRWSRFAGWRNSAIGRFLRVCRPNSHL